MTYNSFNDIEDAELRARNRGVILANIYQDNELENTRNTSQKGVAELFNYFQSIPPHERKLAYDYFKGIMLERGYISVTKH